MSFYWITRLDAICTLLAIVTCVAAIASVLLLIFGLVEYRNSIDEEDKTIEAIGLRLVRHGVRCTIVAFIFGLGLVFVPTTKEMCAIYVVDYLKDNEKVQKMPEQIIDVAASYLDEQLKKSLSQEELAPATKQWTRE